MAYRILLAEDNAVNQLVFQTTMRSFGHDVVVAADGGKALEELDASVFDAVFMDLQMPVMDGVEAARQIRAGATSAPADIPIIALSAYGPDEFRSLEGNALMDAFVAKPMQVDELQRVLESVLDRASHGGTRRQD